MAIIKKKIEDLKPGKNYLITVRAKNSDLNVFSEAADSIKISIPKDPTIPEYPNNLQLYASFEQVMFVFDPAPDIDISYYEYELYESSQVTGSFPSYTISGSPVVSGQSASNVFTVSVQNSSKNDAGDVTSVSYKGRVKSVDTSLNKSFWSPIVTTNQSTPLIDSQYISSLTAGKIAAGTISSAEIIMSGANSIIKSSTFNGTAVGDGSYTGATQGWLINGTGKSYFYDATIVGSIDIGGFDSGSFHVDTSGNLWLGAGSYSSAPFRISNAGNVDVGGADSTSFHIDNSGNIWSGAGAFNASTNPFSVTSAGALTATNANITGTITSTLGTIGGWSIGSTSLSGGSVTLSSSGFLSLGSGNDIAIVSAADTTNRLWIGNATASSAPFRVSKSGFLTATGANISGNITATTITATSSGRVGPFNISSSSFSSNSDAGSSQRNYISIANYGDLSIFSNPSGNNGEFYRSDIYGEFITISEFSTLATAQAGTRPWQDGGWTDYPALFLGGSPGVNQMEIAITRERDAGYYFRVYVNGVSETATVQVHGNFSVSGGTKNFEIDHPIYEGKTLVHAACESNNPDIYYRGTSQLLDGEIEVTLPEYFEIMTKIDKRTITVTPISLDKDDDISLLHVSDIKDGKFKVWKDKNSSNNFQKFHWRVDAVRSDVEFSEIKDKEIFVPRTIGR